MFPLHNNVRGALVSLRGIEAISVYRISYIELVMVLWSRCMLHYSRCSTVANCTLVPVIIIHVMKWCAVLIEFLNKR